MTNSLGITLRVALASAPTLALASTADITLVIFRDPMFEYEDDVDGDEATSRA